MGHLGDFGTPFAAITANEEKRLDTIGVNGAQVRLQPADRIPMFPMSEFARLMALGIPAKDMTAQSTVYGVVEACVFAADFGQFRIGASSMDDESLVNLVFKLYERWANVPLGGTPVSSNGQPATPDGPSKSSGQRSRRVKRQNNSETPEQAAARMSEALGLGPAPSSTESPQN